MNLRVRLFHEVTSTNNLIKDAIAAGEPEGLVVRALQQNAGYGRQGRGWKSPEGGLYCSWLFRPDVQPAHLATLSLVVGLAVQEACQDCVTKLGGVFGNQAIVVKWPNDVVVITEGQPGFKKLCGISTEAVHGAICVGIGINVVAPAALGEDDAHSQTSIKDTGSELAYNEADNFSHASAQASTARCAERIPFYLSSFHRADGTPMFTTLTQSQALDEVFNALVDRLIPAYERWSQEGFAPFAPLFDRYNMLTGHAVELTDNIGHALHQGIVQGVNPDGTLRLQRSDGSEIAASSGEAHVLMQ